MHKHSNRVYKGIFFNSAMQFMSNYTSAAAFRRPLEKQNGERENEQNRRIFWLKNKLLTSTFYTGPGGMSKVKPKPPKKRRKEEKGGNIQKEISPVTHSRVRDHCLLERNYYFLKKGGKENHGGTVVSRHVSGGPFGL